MSMSPYLEINEETFVEWNKNSKLIETFFKLGIINFIFMFRIWFIFKNVSQ